jgi:hypothetical protein
MIRMLRWRVAGKVDASHEDRSVGRRPSGPAQRALMERAKRVVLQIDADIDALQPIDAATFAAARLRNVAGPHPAASDRASACLPADPAAAARPDPCTAADLSPAALAARPVAGAEA